MTDIMIRNVEPATAMEILDWCDTTLSKSWRWDNQWPSKNMRFIFDDPKEANYFILRWQR